MDKYFEEKKRLGLIFTLHNTGPNLSYDSIDRNTGRPIKSPGVHSWWSHASSRFRDANEQEEYINGGCIDKLLSKKVVG